MPKKRVIQAGGSKESPLAGEGREARESDPRGIYVLTETEYAHFRELVDGFLQVISLWQEIFTQEQYIYRHRPLQSTPTRFGETLTYESMHSHFEVLQTPEGLVVSSIDGNDEMKPNRVLYADTWNENTLPSEYPKVDTQRGSSHAQMTFKSGLAGKHLLVDPEGKSLQEVYFNVGSYWGGDSQQLDTYAIYAQPRAVRDIKYNFLPDRLEVTKLFPYMKSSSLMPEAYQTYLINIIDSLIPGKPTATPPPRGRATPEQRSPRQLTAPRRRTLRG